MNGAYPYGHQYTRVNYVEPATIKSGNVFYIWEAFRVPVKGEKYLGSEGKVVTAHGNGVYPQNIVTSNPLRYFSWDKWVYDREDENFGLKCCSKKEAREVKERLNKACAW